MIILVKHKIEHITPDDLKEQYKLIMAHENRLTEYAVYIHKKSKDFFLVQNNRSLGLRIQQKPVSNADVRKLQILFHKDLDEKIDFINLQSKIFIGVDKKNA